MKVGEVFVELFFKSDSMKLKEFIHAIGELDMKSIASVFGLGKMYEMTKKIMEVGKEASESYHMFGEVTGLATDKIQKFAKFSEQMGASTEEAVEFVKGLQEAMTQIKMGGGNVTPFILAKVSPYEEPMKAVEKIHQYLTDPKVPDAIKRSVAQMFGLSDHMLVVMKQHDEIWKTQQKINVLNKEQLHALFNYETGVISLKQSWKIITANIATELAPNLQTLAEITTTISKGLFKWKEYIIPVAEAFTVIVVGAQALIASNPFGLMVVTLGLVITHLHDIDMWMKKHAKGFIDTFEGAKNFVSPALQAASHISGAHSLKQFTNTFNIHAVGETAKDITRSVESVIKKIFSDTEYQMSPETR